MGFLGFYLLAWAGCISLIIADYRENLDQLRYSHEKWLQTYAETFLGDIEVGNTLSVEKKLDILVQRDLVERAVLKFGKHALTTNKPTRAAKSWAARMHAMLARGLGRIVPRNQITLDVADASGTVWGSLAVELDPDILYGPVLHSVEKFIVYGCAFFLICLALILLFIDALTDEVQALIRYIQRFSREASEPAEIRRLIEAPPRANIMELEAVAKEFGASIANVVRLEEEMKAQRVDAAIGEAARQVAHDIRSPLAALDSVLKDLSQLPEDKRVLIRSAVGRIRDIANNLIEKNRETVSPADGENPETAISSGPAMLLSSLIDSLITEKRLQFRSQLGVEVESRLGASSYGLFAEAPPSEFKRVISNLVNNGVEALPGKGLVTVRLSAENDRIEVQVRDNGKGIPPEALSRLGRKGETHGKPGGSGLGLYHAKTSVESWGGALTIASEVGKGTTVTISLPRARPPEWFVSALAILRGTSIVILDDDTSIHQVWQGRFESARANAYDVEIVHFSTPAELRAWVQHSEAFPSKNPIFLMDYELLGYRETGLSLAEELGIGPRTVLVTSRFEEKGVLADATRLKARLIPKALAGFVPIQIAETPAAEIFGAVLIDDDSLARMTWRMAAERAGKSLRPYSTIAEFLRDAGGISRETPIYVDMELADGVNGAAESVRIHELGFKEIYLATGHDAAKFVSFKHLRGIVGKEPPWSRNSTPAPRPASEEDA